MVSVTLNDVDAEILRGFEGFLSFSCLRTGEIRRVPDVADRVRVYGVYAVVRVSDAPPEFLERGTCGDFKGGPYPVRELEAKWVPGTRILYIGKAGGPGEGGAGEDATLQGRVDRYSRFGLGQAVGHGGGRAIWQLADSASLLVCWKEVTGEVPHGVEKALRARFLDHYGKLPFANWKR